MTHLLDGSILVPLVVEDHPHYSVADAWFGTSRPFATCPVTQGSLMRILMHGGARSTDALGILARLTSRPDHEFWPDDIGYDAVDMSRVFGHRQVTDAYLAALARARDGRLATLDSGLAAAHPDVAELIS